MKITKFRFADHANSWQVDKFDLGNLNLLVGVSGVGKTMTLTAISYLSRIANGSSINGIEWDVAFTTDEGVDCNWQGKFENLGVEKDIVGYFSNPTEKEEDDDTDVDEDAPKVISETLEANGKQIIRRDESNIYFQGSPTIKLSPTESVIKLLNQEDDIRPIFQSLKKIIRSSPKIGGRIVDFQKTLAKYPTLEAIQNSDFDFFLKIALTNKNVPSVFRKIKEDFIRIFPQIEDVKIEPINQADLPLQVSQFPFFQIKEKNVDKWILPWELASGMLKSLSVISNMYLLPSNSILLIDELENSLGVNCIDAIGNLLLHKHNLQIIVTSHHPYIINTIDLKYWKILTRKGGVVRVRESKDFERLSKQSLHDNFSRLLEIDEIIQGVEG
jgi:AAA15 family ATPase/GTPase